MVNINTTGAQSGRDFSYGASPIQQQVFIDLYEEVMSKLELLQYIKDDTTFKIELNKIRKKMQKLINDHFSRSISQLKTIEQFNSLAINHETNLNNIIKELSVQ